jgi:hypothetical protein
MATLGFAPIRSKLNGLVLGIADKNTITTQVANGSRAQNWRLTPEGYLESESNNMVISAPHGAPIVVSPKHGYADQQWTVVNACIHSKLNGMVLDIFECRSEPGASVICFAFHGHTNQKWIIQLDEPGASTNWEVAFTAERRQHLAQVSSWSFRRCVMAYQQPPDCESSPTVYF